MHTLLVVDDDWMNREVLEAYLHAAGYTTVPAPNGARALELAAQAAATQPFPLILLDVRLPDINGLEVCRRLRAQAATRHTPILLISALNSDDDKRAAIAAGVDDFLPKPLDALVLVQRVRVLLRMGALPQVLAQHVDETTRAAILRDLGYGQG
jgi:two-component system, cell cycle response regulator